MRFFKKIIYTFVLFFVILHTESFSEVVKDVEIKGNERISPETVYMFGDIKLGSNYESSDVNKLIKNNLS